ncbi:MAG: hypothetical protein H0V26_10745 [Solirubrobacterales bacterium]|nr:hypothetical protein [Solirubrobacterales bacterium]
MLERLKAASERVLRANWREGLRSDGTPYAYTCPSARRYKHQWYWDSCFHAIVWARIEPWRAREELRTLVRAGRSDGLIPHTAFWGESPRWRRAPFYATEAMRGSRATATIQTPLLAFAWERVAAASAQEDPGFANEALGMLTAHHEWLARERDPDGSGLISILLPDESGLDDSPKYDGVYGRLAHDRPGHFVLIDRHRRNGWDAPAFMSVSDLHVKDVLVNVAYALSGAALSRLLGESERSGVHAVRARRTIAALLERCWDERTGLFSDLAGRSQRRVPISTWSALSPLALGAAIGEGVRRRLIDEHLLDPARYRAPYGIPSVSMDEPAFNPGWDRFRTWRGPSWVNTAWLLVPGLDALGHRAEGDRIVGALAEAAGRDGLREYYHPLTGDGLGARDFAFSSLLYDLAAERAGRLASAP